MVRAGELVGGRYRLERTLGKGGMGRAWLARDEVAGTSVAVKVLADSSPALVEAFRAEFATLSGLYHPHLARVHDFGALRDGERVRWFYTADAVEGATLDLFAAEHGWEQVQRAVLDAVHALAFLHRLGVRHGDFKPQNVVVDRDGRSVLVDLGCSGPIDAPPDGLVRGTPGYIAPEVLAGDRVDARADLYALGVSVHRLIEVNDARAAGDRAPAEIRRLALRLRAERAAQRPADAVEVLEALGAAPEEIVLPAGTAAVLHGRDDALAAATDLLDALAGGRPGPRVCWIVGPSGAGRTRLLREIKWSAQMRLPVFEGDPASPRAIAEMLARAAGGDAVERGIAGVLEARERLARGDEPCLLILDDAQRLGDRAREELFALARSLGADDRLALVAAWKAEAAPLVGPGVAVQVLGPLGTEHVSAWTRGLVSARRVPELLRVTGGWPGEIQAVLARVASGAITEDAIGEARVENDAGGAAPLTETAREILGALAVHDGALDDAKRVAMGVRDEALAELARDGWVAREGTAWKLVRMARVPELLAGLGRERRAALHRQAALALGSGAPARTAWHLAEAGDPRAAQMILDAVISDEEDARAWSRAADAAIAQTRPSPPDREAPLRLAAAKIHESAGRPDRALAVLAPLLRRRPAGALGARVRHRVGSACLARGDVRRAIAHLRAAMSLAEGAGDPSLRATAAEALARAHVKRGEPGEALAVARAALADATDPALLADLHDDVGVAASFAGETETARTHLQQAAALHREGGRPRAQARSLSYQALAEYRAGRTAAAIEGWRQALEIAEAHGLADQVPTAALNVGIASHQRGDWGRALAFYERGLRTAVALGRATTLATLRFDLAKLHAEIGLLDRARAGASAGREAATAAGMTYLLAAFDDLDGEIAAAEGRHDDAERAFAEARARFAAHGATRERVEVELHAIELALARGAVAERAVDRAEEALAGARAHGAEDLVARAQLVLGEMLLAAGRLDEARPALIEAMRLAAKVEQRALEAECAGALADACARGGATLLASRHRIHAREIWEEVGSGLPAAMRDVFHAHPERVRVGAGAAPPAEVAAGAPAPSLLAPRREEKLRRLIEINKRLNASLEPLEVLTFTMDAAIELIGAERGFVILVEKQDLRVAVARNLDREKIGKSHLKFSRSIAENVIATGEPVITTDAAADGRFRENVSVHAMRLKSVVSVPIRTPRGVLGALYLDNRFQRGRFEQDDLDLLLAFADQAAIALGNARLHEELERRTRELEAERRRVEALMRGQAEEIDRLAEEVRAKQQVLEHRYDYRNIVGRSPAMHRVLGVIDRVIDTSLDVLIQGESGTGKELIARAIHFNGPRKDAPFVTLNCGAVPANLFESELFGHVRGAFTGADRDREGLLVTAHGGTLFLDELGEMPLAMQPKLLRVLQEREVRPVGSSRSVPIDVRLVCATNRRLREEVAAGRFREDLYYRVAVVETVLPPLRERPEDIPELARHVLTRVAGEMGRALPEISREAMRRLVNHAWPGNVRQLENVITKAVLLSEGGTIRPEDLELAASAARPTARSRAEYRKEEAARILATLQQSRWNMAETARTLGMGRATLYRKVRTYGLAPP